MVQSTRGTRGGITATEGGALAALTELGIQVPLQAQKIGEGRNTPSEAFREGLFGVGAVGVGGAAFAALGSRVANSIKAKGGNPADVQQQIDELGLAYENTTDVRARRKLAKAMTALTFAQQRATRSVGDEIPNQPPSFTLDEAQRVPNDAPVQVSKVVNDDLDQLAKLENREGAVFYRSVKNLRPRLTKEVLDRINVCLRSKG